MKYNNHLNYRDRRRYLFKVRIIMLFIFLSLSAIIGFIYYSVIRDESSNTAASTTSQATSSYFAPSINIFRTPYYQFQADDTWAEVANESTANKFVYRSLRQNLIEHELVVYVDQIPANLEANRVLPVALVSGETELAPSSVSGHCSSVINPSVRSSRQEVVIEGVRINCDADSTDYSVFAGVTGGDIRVPLKRTTGVEARYTLIYKNLKATQDANQFSDILASFQSR